MMADTIDNSADFFDIRDAIERFEELSDKLTTESDEEHDVDEITELANLTELLDNLKGNGGDHEWRGDWYPVTLIRDSYFEDFAQEEAEELFGLVNKQVSWPYTCIDWKQAASELQMDYSSTEFDGVTYWYR